MIITYDQVNKIRDVSRKGLDLRRFYFKFGTYYFVLSMIKENDTFYFDEINTGCNTLEDAVKFIKTCI